MNYAAAFPIYFKYRDNQLFDDRHQNRIGYMYMSGYGVQTDYAEAIKWLKKAIEQENSDAQNNLGYMYYMGYGVKKDKNEAVKWFKKSADQENSSGQYDLADMYENGKGVEKDINKAKELYQKSAKQGLKNAQDACNHLGITY